jgi:ATP-binding cassette, subfamily B (MDR/TAP), member 1
LVSWTTERSLSRLRLAYAKRLLNLDAQWFDSHRGGECVVRLAESTVSIQQGMEKVTAIVRGLATTICGLAIGFATSWKLTLVLAAVAPLFALALAILIINAIASEKAERNAYARAGDVATEDFSLIRTVAAFSAERHEIKRYLHFLRFAEKAGIRKGVVIGLSVGFMLFCFYSMYVCFIARFVLLMAAFVWLMPEHFIVPLLFL